MARRRQQARSGLHAALLLAVDVLRYPKMPSDQTSRMSAAQVIRDFLGRKRLASKLSMRRKRK
jgi:hypothetical protein